MIEANKHPDQAMKIIMGSKDGMKLAKKTMEVQVDLQRDMAKAFEDRDEDIVDELDDLQKKLAADPSFAFLCPNLGYRGGNYEQFQVAFGN